MKIVFLMGSSRLQLNVVSKCARFYFNFSIFFTFFNDLVDPQNMFISKGSGMMVCYTANGSWSVKGPTSCLNGNKGIWKGPLNPKVW
jgi:hypothetical protein